MRIIGLYAALGLGVLGVSAIAATGCSSTTTVDNGDDGGVTTEPDAETDAATPDDTGTATPDTGTMPDAAACGVATDTMNPTCDTCLESQCCSSLEGCYGTDPDAAETSCQMLVSCIQDYETATDGGAFADALDTCAPDSGTTYSATDVANATALLGCLGDGNPSGACAASCAQ
jgi:hypothetical protein